MEYNLIITAEFEDDLDSVLGYISNNLQSPVAASRLLNSTQEKISTIQENPFLYPAYHNEKLAEKGYRYAIVSNYIVFYKVDESNSLISVMRFLYGGQNILAILNN